MATYAHPETLVSTDWAAAHATDPDVRIVEVDVDTKAYDEGHIPGAIAWAWNRSFATPYGATSCRNSSSKS